MEAWRRLYINHAILVLLSRGLCGYCTEIVRSLCNFCTEAVRRWCGDCLVAMPFFSIRISKVYIFTLLLVLWVVRGETALKPIGGKGPLLFQDLQAAMTICSLLLGPVVQSIVSLTSSLRGQLVKCFTT